MYPQLYIQSFVRLKEIYLNANSTEHDNSISNISLEKCTELFKSLNINYPKFFKMDLMSKWGFVATEILLKNVAHEDINPFQKVIILSNTSSSLQTDILFQKTIIEIASPTLFVYTLPNIVAGEIAIRHFFKGENTFFIKEKFPPKLLYQQTAQLFKEGKAQLAICGYLEVNTRFHDILLCLVSCQKSDNKFDDEQLEQLYNK